MVYQKELCLPQFSRGFHLITRYILNELPKKSGIVHVFIKHTSADNLLLSRGNNLQWILLTYGMETCLFNNNCIGNTQDC